MTDLFPCPVTLSPRLAWLQMHDLRTNRDNLPRGYIGPAGTLPWVCSNRARTISAFGDSEEDAIIAYCELTGRKHWTVEEFYRTAEPLDLT